MDSHLANGAAVHRALRHRAALLRDAWRRLTTDDRTSYLSAAADRVDLNYRLRLCDERERRDGVLPR